MDQARFELYSPVITYLVRSHLPPDDGVMFEVEVLEASQSILEILDRGGERAALGRLVEICMLALTTLDRPGDALRRALSDFIPPRGHQDSAARSLRATTDDLYPPTSGPTGGSSGARSAREQCAEFERFVLDITDVEPLLAVIAAQLVRRPQLESEALAANISPAVMRKLKEYAALLPRSSAEEFDAMVSYCSDDRAEVLVLWHALEGSGLRVWFDDRDLVLGSPVVTTLCAVIGAIEKYVFCCGMNLGRWQNYEMQQMVQLVIEGAGGHRIVPVILTSVAAQHDPVPPALAGYKHLDLRKTQHADAVLQLRQAIKS